MARSLSPASYFSRNTSRIRRIDNLSVGIQQTSSGTRSPLPAQTVARPAQGTPWPCPAFADTPDRLNGLRGVDGGEQQTAPGVSGCVQAGGGGRGARRPL